MNMAIKKPSLLRRVYALCVRLPWWGALLSGIFSYVLVSVLLGGFLENHLAAAKSQGGEVYEITLARFGVLVELCHWGGIFFILQGVYFAVRNYIAGR